jgi:multisubunit Na+/H+ antiporter MnhE subunit
MLNVSTLFLILFTFWMIISASADFVYPSFIILGLLSSIIVTIIAYKIRILNKEHPFLFLQIGFYKYLFGITNQNFFKNFKTAFEFIKKNPKIDPVVDFILLNKNNDSEIALYTTSLGLVPGVLCFSIKRKYIVVHLLDKDYFSLLDMYNANKAVSSVYDDSLI